MNRYENKGYDRLLISFDDDKTTIKIILDELRKGHFSPTSNPVYIK